MTKLAGVYRRAGDGNRRALKRRDAFQIDQTRHEISLLTTSLRDDETRASLAWNPKRKKVSGFVWMGGGGEGLKAP